MIFINPKAQSWSIDLALGVIVFMVAFFIFYSALNENPNTKESNLKEDASAVIKEVSSSNGALSIVANNQINESKAGELKNLGYSSLKKRLRVDGDFCIYLEDEKGNVVLINNSYRGIGSPNMNISNAPCSQ